MLKKLLCSSTVLLIILFVYAGLAYGDDLKTGVITANSVNVRETPSISDDNIITQVDKGTKVNIVSVKSDWTKVQYDNVTGWVSNDFIKSTNSVLGTGVVTASVLRVRSSADTSADNVIDNLQKGDVVTVILQSGDWYKVKTSDGTVGWVSNDYVTFKSSGTSRGDVVRAEDSTPAPVTTDAPDTTTTPDVNTDNQDSQGTSDLGQQLVAYAKRFLDSPYVYGGTSPSGFDCSGFVGYVYKHFGISLERTAADQSEQGTRVTKDNLQPGDLIFFDTNGGHNNISHVGMYIGNGKFIHAESYRYGVTITDLYEDYYVNSYMRARRIIN